MSKFTPGPWYWSGDDLSQSESPYENILDKGCCGGYDSCGGFIEWGPNKEANKNLISAAPDMYEALKQVTYLYYLEAETGDFPANMWEEVKHTVLQALAKARGESHE